MPLKTTITPTFISHFPPLPLMAINGTFHHCHLPPLMSNSG